MELQVGRLLNSQSVSYLCRNPSKSVVPSQQHRSNKIAALILHGHVMNLHFHDTIPFLGRYCHVPSIQLRPELYLPWAILFFFFKRYCGTCSTFFYKNIHALTCACVLWVGPSRLILGTMVPSLLVRLLWFLSHLGFLWPIVGLSFSLDPSTPLGTVLQLGGLVCMGTVCQVPILIVPQFVTCLLIGLQPPWRCAVLIVHLFSMLSSCDECCVPWPGFV